MDKWNNPRFFRTTEEIRGLIGNPQYLVGDCRGFPQAVDLHEVDSVDADIILIEIYHTIGRQLRAPKYLESVDISTVFLSPISQNEIVLLRACNVCPVAYVKGLIVHKQITRVKFQQKTIDRALLADIESRATDAVDELRSAPEYSYVIVNHDGEGAENWNRKPDGEFLDEPRGDAKIALDALVEILNGIVLETIERWTHGTI